MSFTIRTSGEFEYTVEGSEEIFLGELELINSQWFSEPSGQYKTPDDTVLVCEYRAETEHGTFLARAEAVRSGFDTYADMRYENITLVPEKCEIFSPPFFEVEEMEDESE